MSYYERIIEKNGIEIVPIFFVRPNPAFHDDSGIPRLGRHEAYRVEGRQVDEQKPKKASHIEKRFLLVMELAQQTERYKWLVAHNKFTKAKELINRALLRELERQLAGSIVSHYGLPAAARGLKGSSLLTMIMIDQQLGTPGASFTPEALADASKNEAIVDLTDPKAKADDARGQFQARWADVAVTKVFNKPAEAVVRNMRTGEDGEVVIVERGGEEPNGSIDSGYLNNSDAYTLGKIWVPGKGWVFNPPKQNPDDKPNNTNETPPEEDDPDEPEEEDADPPDDEEDEEDEEVEEEQQWPNPMANDEEGSFIIFLGLLVDQFLGGSALRQLDKLIAIERGGGVSDPSPISESSAPLLLDGVTFRLIAKSIAGGTGGWVDGVKPDELIPDLNVYQLQDILRKLGGGGAVDPAPENDNTSPTTSPLNPFDDKLPVAGPIPKARIFSISSVRLVAKTTLIPVH